MAEQAPPPATPPGAGPGLWVPHNGQWAWQPSPAAPGMAGALASISPHLSAGRLLALAFAAIATYVSGGQVRELVSGVQNTQTLVASLAESTKTLREESRTLSESVTEALAKIGKLEERTSQLEAAQSSTGKRYGEILESYAAMLKAWQAAETERQKAPAP